MTRVKICGITNQDDAQLAVELGADCLGFVMVPSSPRYVGERAVREICQELQGNVCTVAVVMNRDWDQLQQLIRDCGVEILQLHGDETEELSIRLGVQRTWKAFSLESDGDVAAALRFPARAILIDSVSGDQRGGTGKVGNWDLASKVAQKRRTVLAGGLNPDNVADAIQAVNPWMVDVSSGVEARPGRKDPKKLGDFVAAVRDIAASKRSN